MGSDIGQFSNRIESIPTLTKSLSIVRSEFELVFDNESPICIVRLIALKCFPRNFSPTADRLAYF